MKKRYLISLIFLFIVFVVNAYSSNNSYEYVSKVLGIDLSMGKISNSIDSHGGFHGDGITYIEMTFSEKDSKDIVKVIENNGEWNKLPLSENLNIVLYGKENPGESLGPYITNGGKKPIFPRVHNGYYYFIDRHRERKDIRDDTDLLNRYSFNFTIAIYDIDNRALYYCEFDT